MSLTLEQLFPNHRPGDEIATALDSHAIVNALALACSGHSFALLRMQYPSTDANTHHSRDQLTEVLHRHGLHLVANMIDQDSPYLLFTSATNAWLTFLEIRRHSAAIGVQVYYRGLSGAEAESRLRADGQPKQDDGHFKPHD